ncbi:hypothetical protein GWI33_001548 [Rhynchophorus ferrugineus]|uniref:Uncharacterized protein n=1 Tax=Rhynchophorus ferrugineus TaxID=354439 RepID=A0A834IQE4_RHYFE|nr:hypothetical protein GWI33_001548 [Rhynchophorus ferrugineus]
MGIRVGIDCYRVVADVLSRRTIPDVLSASLYAALNHRKRKPNASSVPCSCLNVFAYGCIHTRSKDNIVLLIDNTGQTVSTLMNVKHRYLPKPTRINVCRAGLG